MNNQLLFKKKKKLTDDSFEILLFVRCQQKVYILLLYLN